MSMPPGASRSSLPLGQRSDLGFVQRPPLPGRKLPELDRSDGRPDQALDLEALRREKPTYLAVPAFRKHHLDDAVRIVRREDLRLAALQKFALVPDSLEHRIDVTQKIEAAFARFRREEEHTARKTAGRELG